MRRRWAATFCAIFALILGAGAARAQSAPDLNRAAGLLFEKGDFAAASRLLEVVLRLQPSAKAHKNLALCYAKMPGREEQAILHIQAYVRARPDAKEREFVERMIAELDERIAQRGSLATLESLPEGAEVFLDDDEKSLGRAPVRTRLPLGEHALRFERRGYETVRRKIEVRLRQELRVAVALTPALRDSVIIVRASEAGAMASIDARRAVIGRNVVTPGAHQVRVVAPGRKAWDVEIHVAPGGIAEVVPRLEVAPPSRFEPPRPLKAWRWVGVTVTALATASAIVGYVRATMDRDRAASFDGQSFGSLDALRAAVAKEQRSASTNSNIATAGLVTAIAGAAATTTFFLLDWRHQHAIEPPRRAVTIAPVPGGALLGFVARF